jgi:hypothetical protein
MKCVCFDNFPTIIWKVERTRRKRARSVTLWQASKRSLIYCPRKTIRHAPFHMRCKWHGARTRRDRLSRPILLTWVLIGDITPLLPLDTHIPVGVSAIGSLEAQDAPQLLSTNCTRALGGRHNMDEETKDFSWPLRRAKYSLSSRASETTSLILYKHTSKKERRGLR